MINNLFTFVRTLGNQRIEGKKFFTGQVGILGSLSDSSGSLGTAGKVLSTTGSGVQWITVGSSNVQSLNDLSDVIITTAATGQLLRFNGTNWVNWTHSFLDSSSTLGDLFNVGSSADGANDGDILRFNEQSGLWVADEFPTLTEADTLDSVTDRGATTTNSITVGGVSTSGTVTAAVVTTPLIEREGVLTINSEQQVDQGEPNPNLLYVSWMGDNKFVINADGYAIANTGYKVVGGTASGFLKANGSIDTSTYLTSYTETQTLDNVTDLGATTTNAITVGGVTAPILEYGGLLTIDADNTGSLQPGQGDPTVPVLNFDWAGNTQGYIDTDGKITFNGFKTPTGTSSGFLKANGTVDTNAYITEVEYIDDIGDVVISSANLGDVLTFNGSQWVNSSIDSADWVSKVQHEVKAGMAITKGQPVYVTGADGTNMIVGRASNISEAMSSKVIGLAAASAATNHKFFVITEGLIAGLNTSSANAGDAVWLGVDGGLIFGLTNKPVAPAHLVYIGVVTRKNANNGEIFVNVQNGFELNELHDVLINGVATGDLLRRDINGLWKNWTPNYITASSVDTLLNKTIELGTGIATIVAIDAIDGLIGQVDIPMYQFGIDKGGTISVDGEGTISISNPGIGYVPGTVTTVGGTRFVITVTGNVLTGNLAEFNVALTDGSFATEAYVTTQITNLVDSAPSTLDTLNELAAALGDDPNFATTVATSIGTKQNQLNGTGFVKASGTTITYDNSTYLTTESDPVFTASAAYGITSEQITSWDTAYGWGNHAEVGYLTSFTETDPIFTASAASGITTEQIGFWDEAYGWGNHALAGYLTALPAHNHNDLYYTETESDLRFYLATNPSGYQTTSGTVANIASGSTTNLNSAWTVEGTSIANGFRVYRYDSSAANKPVTADNANWLINIFSHPSGGAASYGHQLAAANTNNIYFRSVSNGTFSDWHKFWSTNDFSSTTVSQWNTAYGWGNHATAGYLTSLPVHNHDDRYYTETEINSFLSGKVSTENFKVLGGGINYDVDRTLKVESGLAIYGAYSGGINSPFTYDIAAQFAFGSRGFELSADWINDDGANLKLRTLRDCCTNWSPWVDVITSYNIGQYALTSLPAHTHTIANVTGLQTALDGKLSTSGKAADSELLDGVDESRFVYGNSDTRRGTNLISNWNQNDYPDVAFLSAENGGTNAPTGDYTYGTQYSFHRSGAAYRTQLVTALYSDTSIYVRNSRDSDVWTSWKRLWHSGDFSSTNISNWNTAYGWGNHAGLYLPLSGGTMTGSITLKYSTADSSDYDGLRFAPYSDVAGLDDYIIKAASDKGVFGRKSFGWHIHTESAFGVYSSGWTQLFGVEGGTGNTQVFGSLTVSGSITESSSIRYKKDILDIEPASSKIELLRPVRYKKIKDESEEIGLIAEDVAQLFPEVVKYDNEGRPDGVNYSRLSVILLKAVQELTERVNKLENK
jgi:hypothetical protein